MNKNNTLSEKLVIATGGRFDTPGLNCEGRKWLPGCNAIQYYYGDIPPKGSDNNFTPGEDFAESVAAYVFPSYADAQVSGFRGNEKEQYLFYSNYTKTKRWAFINNLNTGNK